MNAIFTEFISLLQGQYISKAVCDLSVHAILAFSFLNIASSPSKKPTADDLLIKDLTSSRASYLNNTNGYSDVDDSMFARYNLHFFHTSIVIVFLIV